MAKPRKYVTIEESECKGCGLCVDACARGCITMGAKMNQLGYVFAKFDGDDCTACGLCFYSCPEPGAITVFECEADESGK